jgi:Domain of unknown function (DUF4429)/Short C-terminal domain
MIFDGRNGGTVELSETGVVIRRKGVLSALNQGLKGEKRIPYASIMSVQFKEAGFTTGYIQFGVLGGQESRAGVWDAVKDENTVLFTKEASADFQRLRDLVEERIGHARTSTIGAAPSAGLLSEELTRLADLRDRGVLTEDEFLEQKKRLLETPKAPSPAIIGSPVPATKPRAAESPEAVGREPLDGKKMGAAQIAGWGCLGFLFLIFVLAAIGSSSNNSADSNSAEGSLTAADLNATSNLTDADVNNAMAEATPQAASSWSYSQSVDKVRGGTTYYASTTSTNSIAQEMPYSSETRMRMEVRKSPAYGTDVILTISSGQMMCPSYEGCSGMVRFDDGPAQRVSFSGPADNSSDTIFVDGAKSFVAKLKKAKHVTIEKTLYEAGNPQFEFDVGGLKWDH